MKVTAERGFTLLEVMVAMAIIAVVLTGLIRLTMAGTANRAQLEERTLAHWVALNRVAELRAEFMSEAEAAHRPASQILRELMREFVQRQREAREYDEFLRHKVEAGRASMQDGQGRSNDEVETEFATRRARVTRRS